MSYAVASRKTKIADQGLNMAAPIAKSFSIQYVDLKEKPNDGLFFLILV